MAGANMSGELARPSVSIPRGTVQAVFTTFAVYILTAFLMACTASRNLLQNEYTVMMDTDFQRWCILMGIFATTWFSSMSNLIGQFILNVLDFSPFPGSSRVLNRLAHDKLFGCLLRPASFEVGGDKNPIISVVVTWFFVIVSLSPLFVTPPRSARPPYRSHE